MPQRNSNRTWIIVVILVVILLIAGGLYWGLHNSSENQARAVVTEFGSHLKDVSLLAPNASSTIGAVYAPYVDPSLLAAWQASPQDAPGRAVSSPWPDSIVIDSIQPQGQGYIVNGHMVFMTSEEQANGGNAGTQAVVLQIAPESGQWLIVAFESAATSSPQ